MQSLLGKLITKIKLEAEKKSEYLKVEIWKLLCLRSRKNKMMKSEENLRELWCTLKWPNICIMEKRKNEKEVIWKKIMARKFLISWKTYLQSSKKYRLVEWIESMIQLNDVYKIHFWSKVTNKLELKVHKWEFY